MQFNPLSKPQLRFGVWRERGRGQEAAGEHLRGGGGVLERRGVGLSPRLQGRVLEGGRGKLELL